MTTEVVSLPEPNYPMVVHVFTAYRNDPNNRVVQWSIGSDHPYVQGFKVVRMFADEDGVEVYSYADAGGGTGMRDQIPMHQVRLIQEGMPLKTFVEELEIAESPDDDGTLEEDDESHPPATNGQVAP